MKKSILFLSLLIAGSTSFSAQIKCQIDLTVVGKTGLLPTDSTMSWQTDLQDEKSLDFQKCANHQIGSSENLVLCAKTTAAVGVYEAAVFSADGANEAEIILGTSNIDRKKLVSLHQTYFVFNSFKNKMKALKIHSPEKYTNDSLLLDEAVVNANAKSKESLLGLPVTMGFDGCEIVK